MPISAMTPLYQGSMSPLRSSRGPWASGGGAEDDLDGSVLLLLEGLVGGRALGERDAVGGEADDAERVALGQQRHDVVDQALDVGLAHAQLGLLVENGERGQRVGREAVDAAPHYGGAAAQEVERRVKG